MDQNISALERAFELAKSGKFERVVDIRTHLMKEGYLTDQITGRTLSSQLKSLMATVKVLK